MPASPTANNYPLNEQWAPLALYGKRAPLRRKLHIYTRIITVSLCIRQRFIWIRPCDLQSTAVNLWRSTDWRL